MSFWRQYDHTAPVRRYFEEEYDEELTGIAGFHHRDGLFTAQLDDPLHEYVLSDVNASYQDKGFQMVLRDTEDGLSHPEVFLGSTPVVGPCPNIYVDMLLSYLERRYP